MTDKPPVVAVFNSNDDTVELIRAWFEDAGIVVVSAHLDEVKRGSVDLMSFVDQHKPAAVVFDIAPPYERSWRRLRIMLSRPSVSNAGKTRPSTSRNLAIAAGVRCGAAASVRGDGSGA